MSNNIPVLSSQQAIAVVKSGLPTDIFYRFINAVRQAFGTGSPTGVTVSPSPMTYVSLASGYLIVAGGAVTKIEYSADGKTFFDVGQIGGMFPLAVNAYLRITYTAPPTLTFAPGAA